MMMQIRCTTDLDIHLVTVVCGIEPVILTQDDSVV